MPACDEVRQAILVEITDALAPNALRPRGVHHDVLKAHLRVCVGTRNQARRQKAEQELHELER